MIFKTSVATLIAGVSAFSFAACTKSKGRQEPAPAASRFLYVASGLCQAGANTTFTTTTSSNVVYRINAESGARDSILADYNAIAGESPVGVADFDGENLLVVVEKTGARRIEKVGRRLYGDRSLFSTDVAALANTLLDIRKAKSGGVFVSRTNGVALVASTGATQISTFASANPGGSCGTSNSKYASLAVTDQGHLVVLNSESNDNKIAILKTGPVCLAGTTPTPGTALLTAAVFVRGHGQLIVAASGNSSAASMNTLSVYDVTETATSASLGAPTVIYDVNGFPSTYPYRLYAVSAMAYDADRGHLYVASANVATTNIATNGNYVIEKFTYDPTTKTLTRIGAIPFYGSGVDTKCISSMFVGT